MPQEVAAREIARERHGWTPVYFSSGGRTGSSVPVLDVTGSGKCAKPCASAAHFLFTFRALLRAKRKRNASHSAPIECINGEPIIPKHSDPVAQGYSTEGSWAEANREG